MKVTSAIVALGALVMLGGVHVAAQDVSPAQPESPYLGASGCRSCHEAIHDAWNKTKHANAILRLSGGDKRSGKCIRCHVTGSDEQIAAEADKPSLPNVQCEACHGPARAHAVAAKTEPPAAAGLVPAGAGMCERCHNKTSPHYKPFFYNGMRRLVHLVREPAPRADRADFRRGICLTLGLWLAGPI
jgi:hypothetical protein